MRESSGAAGSPYSPGVTESAEECIARLERELEARAERSERRFRLLVESNADVICVTDPRRFRYVSPAGYALFGYDADSLVGRDALEFAHPEDRARAEAALERLLSTPTGVGARACASCMPTVAIDSSRPRPTT